MTLGEWILQAADRLQQAGIESARLEAEVIAAHAVHADRSWVLAHRVDSIDLTECENFLTKRLTRIPLAYLLGYREFYGRKFEVSPAVLIPRQDTELLVELALKLAPEQGRCLDVGTGSGCIAISVKAERPDLEVWATDISPSALEVARRNAAHHLVSVEFRESDLFDSLQGEQFDVVVSNPPYIEIGTELMPEVQDHEPHHALFSKEQGLHYYRRISQEAPCHMSLGGHLILELGVGQAESVRALFPNQSTSLYKDLSGIERALVVSF